MWRTLERAALALVPTPAAFEMTGMRRLLNISLFAPPCEHTGR
jgi:hypothetical protein